MNFADQLMALAVNRDPLSNQYRNYCHKSNISINSTSSFSDEEDDIVFSDKNKDSSMNRLNHDLATVFANNQLLNAQERIETRPKKNVYVQQRVKHHSGGAANGGKKMTTAWKRITDKLTKSQHKSDRPPKLDEAWRRYSLDTQMSNGDEANESRRGVLGKHAQLTRLASLDDEDRPREHRPIRPRSNSMVSHFKILSKHAGVADFTVTEPSKLADASALCQEYFSRLTCYDAVPQFASVIAVDKEITISRVFNIFCDNNATAIVLWDSLIRSAVSTCHVDDLVCRLWTKARRSGTNRLFDEDGDFSRPLGEFCSIPFIKSVPVNTSLMDAARFLCKMSDDGQNRSCKRLALTNESTSDVVHLLSAWDVLYFFSQQISKFRAAHTAFDLTLATILEMQPESYRRVEVLNESRSLKDVINSLASHGGRAVVSRFGLVPGRQAVVTLSFMDIIRYIINSHGSWNEADATDNTLGHVLRHYKKKDSLVFKATTPLFAILNDWVPSMTADMPIVVVEDSSVETVFGLLEPEHLLQALLLDTAHTRDHISIGEIPVSTRL